MRLVPAAIICKLCIANCEFFDLRNPVRKKCTSVQLNWITERVGSREGAGEGQFLTMATATALSLSPLGLRMFNYGCEHGTWFAYPFDFNKQTGMMSISKSRLRIGLHY